MITFGAESATLFRREENGWQARALSGCSLRRTAKRGISDKTAVVSMETVCRMPPENPLPLPGDVILPGVWSEGPLSEIALARLLEAERPSGAFRVRSVADNARPGMPLPHYAVRGE